MRNKASLALPLNLKLMLEKNILCLTTGDVTSASIGEMKFKIMSDVADRQSLHNALNAHPMKHKCHPLELIGVVIGQIALDTVTVDKALEIGT